MSWTVHRRWVDHQAVLLAPSPGDILIAAVSMPVPLVRETESPDGIFKAAERASTSQGVLQLRSHRWISDARGKPRHHPILVNLKTIREWDIVVSGLENAAGIG